MIKSTYPPKAYVSWPVSALVLFFIYICVYKYNNVNFDFINLLTLLLVSIAGGYIWSRGMKAIIARVSKRKPAEK